MTATKHRLGRDPELHYIHDTIADADAYLGKPGEITFVRAVPGGPLVQQRDHDGALVGGYVLGLVAAGSLAATFPAAVALPPVTITTTDLLPVNFNHLLGYYPMVQVLDPTGAPITPSAIVHPDVENTQITFSSIGTYTVIFR